MDNKKIPESCKLVLDYLLTITEIFYKECYDPEDVLTTKNDDIFNSEEVSSKYLKKVKKCIEKEIWNIFQDETKFSKNKTKFLTTIFLYGPELVRWIEKNNRSNLISDEEYEFVKESLELFHCLCSSIKRKNFDQKIKEYETLLYECFSEKFDTK